MAGTKRIRTKTPHTPHWDRLEARTLLSGVTAAVAPTLVPGNLGFIRHSQFQVEGFPDVATQWRLLTMGGPISIGTDSGSAPVGEIGVVNTGNILRSQFSQASFAGFAAQLEKVNIAGALVINVRDESMIGSGTTSVGAGQDGVPINSGDIIHTQFHSGGFGSMGIQWRRVDVSGDLRATSQTFVRNPDGTAAVATTAGATTGAEAASRGPAQVNTGLVKDSQFNDGGFGKVGLQFRGVRVRGSVGVGLEQWLIQNPTPPSSTAGVAVPATIDRTTNTGTIRDVQFNDGGFGDTGLQWNKVGVRGNVGTSSNVLSIQPTQAGTGPITVADLSFGQGQPSASVAGVLAAGARQAAAKRVSTSAAVAAADDEKAATNSGLMERSQVNDGGFGDIGLQWRKVHVRGGVSAVHNSLSVQPENDGQGLITVRNIRFPSSVSGLPTPVFTTKRAIPDNLPLIRRDGTPVTTPLPPRTYPFQEISGKNEATNSGNIVDSQFNDGGFGDIGLQWLDVQVDSPVRVVHNSLSIQPEKSNLAGVDVSDVRFGDRTLNPLATQARKASKSALLLVSTQATDAKSTSVYLQKNRQTGEYGLLVINNILVVAANRVTLEDVVFPPETLSSFAASKVDAQAVDAATNSGILVNTQFNDGGFGDVALQWRNVHVTGPVTVVHNSLSVNVIGTGTGPINISNVAFNSGALPQGTSGPIARAGVKALRAVGVVDAKAGSGVVTGGQISRGGVGHIGLQLAKRKITGPVTVIDNILSIKSTDPTSGPIAVRHVTFG